MKGPSETGLPSLPQMQFVQILLKSVPINAADGKTVLNNCCHAPYGWLQVKVICFSPRCVKPVIRSYPSRPTTAFPGATIWLHV